MFLVCSLCVLLCCSFSFFFMCICRILIKITYLLTYFTTTTTTTTTTAAATTIIIILTSTYRLSWHKQNSFEDTVHVPVLQIYLFSLPFSASFPFAVKQPPLNPVTVLHSAVNKCHFLYVFIALGTCLVAANAVLFPSNKIRF